MLLLLASCVIGTRPTPDARQPTAESRARQMLVAPLLIAARIDFEEKRLTTPAGRNAYQKYLQVLSIDQLNRAAVEGINAIVEQYLSWAVTNLDKGNYARASRYLGKARFIDATHPSIQPVTTHIDKARARATTVYRLDADAVAQRRTGEIDFRGISAQILENRAFVTIRAINDATGRWLYQELSRYTEVRIEAMFETGHPPSISLVMDE